MFEFLTLITEDQAAEIAIYCGVLFGVTFCIRQIIKLLR